MSVFGVLYILASVCCCARASEDHEQESEEKETKGKRVINTSEYS